MKIYRVSIWLADRNEKFKGSPDFTFTIAAGDPKSAAKIAGVWLSQYTDFNLTEMRRWQHKASIECSVIYYLRTPEKSPFKYTANIDESTGDFLNLTSV